MGMIGKSFLQDDLIDITTKMKKKVVKKAIGNAPVTADGLDKYLDDDSDDSDSSADSFEE